VTKPEENRRCRWCGRRFEVTPGRGRPREYCRRSCRQRDYEARQRSSELGIGESQLVVSRAEIDTLHDRLYALEAAVEDAERDIREAARPTTQDYRTALEWVLAAARPLIDVRLGDPSP
jgi:hypothetical protein